MKKIEVLVSSLKFAAIGEKQPIVLGRGDHYPAVKIEEHNLSLMVKGKLVKIVGEDAKPKPAPKKIKEPEPVEVLNTEAVTEANEDDSEF